MYPGQDSDECKGGTMTQRSIVEILHNQLQGEKDKPFENELLSHAVQKISFLGFL